MLLFLVTAVFALFSGAGALLRLRPILPGMARAGVPESWLVFPIGVLKLAGGAGLLAGLWLPGVGTAAAFGLVLYFTCAVYTHLRAADFSAQFYLACAFLALCAATLAVGVQHGGDAILGG
ncbi:DoxX family protein [Dactylosporangium sp. AC04546]|uniref:DoxX family protein n=1 Tax=Dactylosporangium sp. AC04546 TaxID=2862460 RepID=UPI001EDF7BF7|nr:DoxX family protein [Dactylosporangium sp. AC04546]WVK85963.1 DoxX family protein [Dactylosporangium sp. AC04546]